MSLEIYDCTLREGEQADGANFNLEERMKIVMLLDELGADYIELGWPIARIDIMNSFHEAMKLNLKKSRIVAFGSTSISENPEEDRNLLSIVESGVKYACIFGKSSLSHVEKQLKISAENNLKKISDSIIFLKNKNINVFYDAEHFFDSFKDNEEYAIKTIDSAINAGALKIILCDTNGGSMTAEIKEITEKVRDYLNKAGINAELGIHCHNDCGLALANSLACLPYVKQIQGTINGIGERVGNTDLCELLPNLLLKLNINMDIKLETLKELSREIYKSANLPEQVRQAFLSPRAFLHKGGIHVDATVKGASYEHINPEDLGLEHELILSSLGGAACIINTAKKFGYVLDKNKDREKINKLLDELSVLENKGYDSGNTEAEQEIMIKKNFGDFREFFSVIEWEIRTDKDESECYVKCRINEEVLEIKKKVKGGPVDAAYEALSELIGRKYKLNGLKILDYKVRIAKSKGAESSVRTKIEFIAEEEFEVIGVDENVISSSIEALSKGFNYCLNKTMQV